MNGTRVATKALLDVLTGIQCQDRNLKTHDLESFLVL